MTTRWGKACSTAIVIPALNEARTIAGLVGRCRARLGEHLLIVIDDGSTDDTASLAAARGALVLSNPVRLGKGASLRRGMQVALEHGCGHARVVTLDGDGQHRPEDIPRLIAASDAFPDHIVIGVRRRGPVPAPRARLIANHVGNFWISWAARQPIADVQSGFRVYPAALVMEIVTRSGWHPGFAFESEILIEGARLGFPILGIDVPRIEFGARGRPSHFRPFRDNAEIVVLVGRELLSHGMDPVGLWRSLKVRARRAPREGEGTSESLRYRR